MSVDLSKIRPGDEITIRCRARVRASEGWTIRALHDEQGTLVKDEHIVAHTPKALVVGDRVKVGPQVPGDGLWAGQVRRIAALEGADAWLADDKGEHLTVGLDRLERVDA